LDKFFLLDRLPRFKNNQVLIEKKQSVHDIIREVLTAHRIFAKDYDLIAKHFWRGNVYDTLQYLWQFCKANIPYKVESEDNQTTKSPAAILLSPSGDCKHYSGFIGGVLAALVRSGKKIDWAYRFASYDPGTRTPEHVFIVAKTPGGIYWIDPVLKTFNERLQPSSYIDKKISTMALTRISGIDSENTGYPVSDILEDAYLNNPLYTAIQTLLKYGVMNSYAKVNLSVIEKYRNNPAVYNELKAAFALVQQNAIGGFFSNIWRGVKKVTLAPIRGAFLSLVAINAFGWAKKLHDAIYNPDGNFSAYKEKIKDIWQNKFAGDFSALINTVNNNYHKKAILGAAPTIPAWVAAASAIIAALTPVITAALRARQQQFPAIDPNIDPATGLPYGSPQAGPGASPLSDPVQFLKDNPVILIGGIAAIYFLTKKRAA